MERLMQCAQDSSEILYDIITDVRDRKETKEISEFIGELELLSDEHKGECVFQSFLKLIQENHIRNLSDPRYIQAKKMLSIRPSVYTDGKPEAVYIPRTTLHAFRDLNELYNAGRLDPENSAHAEFLEFKQRQQQRQQQRRLGGKKKSGKKGGKKGGKKSHKKKGGKKSHKKSHKRRH